MQKLSNAGTNDFHKLPRAFKRVAGEIDDDIRIELPDLISELARCFRMPPDQS